MSTLEPARVLTAIWFMLPGSSHDLYVMYAPELNLNSGASLQRHITL